MGMLLLLAVGSFLFPLFFFFSSASFLLINFLRTCPPFWGGMRSHPRGGPLGRAHGFGFWARVSGGVNSVGQPFREPHLWGDHITGCLHGDERRP